MIRVFSVVIAGIIAFALIALIVASVRKSREGKRRFHAALQQAGYSINDSPEREDQALAFARVQAMGKTLSSGQKGIKMVSTAQGPRGPQCIMRHEYHVHTGQATVTVVHMMSVVPASPNWPVLRLTRRGWWSKRLGRGSVELEQKAFNDRWKVSCASTDFALLLLTPELQEWLAKAPKIETWCIGEGSVICAWKRGIKPDEVAILSSRPHELLDRVPPELDAWSSTLDEEA